jgi:hypothetical protein
MSRKRRFRMAGDLDVLPVADVSTATCRFDQRKLCQSQRDRLHRQERESLSKKHKVANFFARRLNLADEPFRPKRSQIFGSKGRYTYFGRLSVAAPFQLPAVRTE